MKKLLRRFFLFSGLLLLFICLFLIRFYNFLNTPLLVDKSGYILTIAPGTPVKKIVQQLTDDKILASPNLFLLWVRCEGVWHELKAGEYLIKSGTTPIGLTRLLQSGKVIQHAITLVPGWTFARVLQEIKMNPHLAHTLKEYNPREVMTLLGHPRTSPEGQFFPETYYFPLGTTDIAFLRRAHQLLQQKLIAVWEMRDEKLPVRSPYEALILASIIEKESGVQDEYEDIAGVYSRRLLIGMPLQADPTVIYGLGKEYQGTLTRLLLKKVSPYNTYQILGLPPTPIALASLGAIEAAVHPKAGESLYFVATGDGKRHVFSSNYRDHQLAVLKYRKTLLSSP